jgi:hypothetical protein
LDRDFDRVLCGLISAFCLLPSAFDMACPICGTTESAAVAAGIRAGALVLVLVVAAVTTAIGRFAWRLYKLDGRT